MKLDKLIAFLFVFLWTVAGQNLWAQPQTVTGKIIDAQNRQPLAFVNVVVNEGLTGTMSDIDGRYEINSPVPVRLIKFSSIGYDPQTI